MTEIGFVTDDGEKTYSSDKIKCVSSYIDEYIKGIIY